MSAGEFKNVKEKIQLAVLKYASYTLNILIVFGILYLIYSAVMFIVDSM